MEVLIAGSLSALLGAALIYLLSHFADLSGQLTVDRGRQAELQRATSLLRKDVSQAAGILEAGDGRLLLHSPDGDSLYFALGGATADTLFRYITGQTPAVVATGVDSFWTARETITIPRWREAELPETTLVVASQCDEQDMDAQASSGGCDGWDAKKRGIEDTEWAGAQFWDTAEHPGFVWAEVKLFNDESAVEVDLILQLHRNDGPFGYPGTLLARGRIPKDNLTKTWAWHGCPLTSVTPHTVTAGATYWLVARPDGAGDDTYAGDIQFGETKGCDWNPQANGKCYGKTDNAGGTWQETDKLTKELIYRVYGPVYTSKLKEVVQNDSDPIGVSYALVLTHGDSSSRSEGFIALRNL